MAKGKIASVVRIVQRLAESPTASLCDRDLLERFVRSQDQSVFETLIARHSAMVLGVCRRELANLADAEDATQAVFLLLARKAADQTWQPSVAGWLYDTARKVSRNARVAAIRRAVRETRASARAPISSPPEDLTVRELLHALDEELDRLARRYREPLVLCYLEGLTRDEAALRLGVQPNTLKIQLERGRKKLADALTRRGCTLGTLLLAISTSGNVATANLSKSILTTVTGIPSETVTALAKGVPMNSLLATTKLCLAGVFFTTVIGFAFTTNEPDPPIPPNPPRQKGEAPVPKAEARLDRFEAPLPEGAVMRLGTTQFRAVDLISVGFRKTGGLAALTGNLTLTIWPPEGSPQPKVISVSGTTALSLSPDARYVVTTSDLDAELMVWDVTGEKPVQCLSRKGFYFSCGSQFSPDAEWLVVHHTYPTYSDPNVKPADKPMQELFLCHLPTKEWTVLPGIDFTDTNQLTLSFTSDGKRLLVANAWQAWLVDTVKKTVIRRLRGWYEGGKGEHPFLFVDREGTVELSPDGKMVVTVPGWHLHQPDPVVPLHSSETGKEIARFQRPVSWARFSPDGKSLWAGGRSSLFEVDPSNGKVLREIAVSASRPVRFSPDGKTLALHTQSAVILVDGQAGKVLRPELLNGVALAPIIGIAVSPDGKVIATDDAAQAIQLWDALTGKPLGRVESARFRKPLFEFLPHSRTFLAVGPDHLTIGEYESSNGKERRRFSVPEYYAGKAMVRQIQLSPDGKILTADILGKTIDLARWDIASGKVIRRESKERPDPLFIAPEPVRSRDGKWTVEVGQLSSIDGYKAVQLAPNFWPIKLTADSRFALWSSRQEELPGGLPGDLSEQITIFDLTQRTRVGELRTGCPTRFAISPDGRWVGVRASDELAVWEFVSRQKVWSVPFRPTYDRFADRGTNRCQDEGMALTPDGRRLISAEDCNVIVWDVSGTGRAPGEAASPLAPDALNQHFESLAGENAAAAHRAAWELSDRPAEAVALLRDRLKPVTIDAGKLIDRLDSPAFTEREAAGKELLELDQLALAELRSRLGDKLSAEQKTRIDAVLKQHAPPNSLPSVVLRHTRAVTVLERIATVEARNLLKELAEGIPEATLTREATRALERLSPARER
jgi:RNA polymerase sigma factor (sigma-70 family)